MPDISHAPWDEAQVMALSKRQRHHDLHPYTCPNQRMPLHLAPGILCPHPDGWHCHGCDYTQDWAHLIDTKGGPE